MLKTYVNGMLECERHIREHDQVFVRVTPPGFAVRIKDTDARELCRHMNYKVTFVSFDDDLFIEPTEKMPNA